MSYCYKISCVRRVILVNILFHIIIRLRDCGNMEYDFRQGSVTVRIIFIIIQQLVNFEKLQDFQNITIAIIFPWIFPY